MSLLHKLLWSKKKNMHVKNMLATDHLASSIELPSTYSYISFLYVICWIADYIKKKHWYLIWICHSGCIFHRDFPPLEYIFCFWMISLYKIPKLYFPLNVFLFAFPCSSPTRDLPQMALSLTNLPFYAYNALGLHRIVSKCWWINVYSTG